MVKRGQMIKNTRGLSAVIVTLILILLSIVLIGIVWVVVSNIVNNVTQQISLGKFLINLKIKQASINGNNILVRVSRDLGEGHIVAIDFILSDGSNDEPVVKNSSLNIYESKVFNLSSLKFSNVSDIKKVSVAPIYLTDSNKRVIGSITDTYYLGGNLTLNGGLTGGGTLNPGGGGNGIITGNGTNSGGNASGCTPAQDPTFLGLCGSYECGYVQNGTCDSVTCGTCNTTSFCNFFKQCEAQTVINSGVILSVWPSGAVKYFDSENLPKSSFDIVAYNDGQHYVRFPNSNQSNCTQIALVEYLSENNLSYVKLVDVVNITFSNQYEIWSGQAGCEAAA